MRMTVKVLACTFSAIYVFQTINLSANIFPHILMKEKKRLLAFVLSYKLQVYTQCKLT